MKNLTLALVVMTFISISPSLALAEGDGTGRPEQIKEDKSAIVLSAPQIACIKTALTKREDALISGHGAYSTAIASAYTARKTALLAAWDKPTAGERKIAVKAADRAFQEATKSVRMTWNTARRSAWKTFETDRKACNVQVSSAETGTSKSDSAL